MGRTKKEQDQRKRAIALIRVSQRDKDALSPEVQRRAVKRLAEEHGWQLRDEDILDENVDDNGKVRNVSGSWSLEDRPKLRYVIEEIEAGRAQVGCSERFDRMFRNELLRRMVVKRVEEGDGELWSASGQMTNQRAEGRLAQNVNGDVSEYTLETAAERSWDAVEIAIEEGRWFQKLAPLGYVVVDGRLKPDPDTKRIVVRAYAMRKAGKSFQEIQAYLASKAIDRSISGVRKMLSNRVYVGEIHFGKHTPNLLAHDGIIDPEVFEYVDAMVGRERAGRRGKSERLLARLGVLRCGSCDGRMSVSSGAASGKEYPMYRCTSGRCRRPLAIGAELVEESVNQYMRGRLMNEQAVASAEQDYAEAVVTRDRAQKTYDSFTEVFDPTEAADVKRRAILKTRLDEAKADVDRMKDLVARSSWFIGQSWDQLTLDEKREAIRLHLYSVEIGPGRGMGRVGVREARANEALHQRLADSIARRLLRDQ